MAQQLSLFEYAKSVQFFLSEKSKLNDVKVPVFMHHNRNVNENPNHVIWAIENSGQEVYTGPYQQMIGIDRPTFSVLICSNESAENVLKITDSLLVAMNGYTGLMKDMWVAKVAMSIVESGYDDKTNFHVLRAIVIIDMPA